MMSDLAKLDPDFPINQLVDDLPGFIHWDITVSDVFELMMGDASGYIQGLNLDWVTLVYRIHHGEIIDWLECKPADLIDRDYSQQAVNFVLHSTLVWCKKFCEAYAKSDDSDKIEDKINGCKVFDLDSYRVRLH
jgi:hypothetical protein